MSFTTYELLGQLLELTPLPPAEPEIDALLAAFEAIVERRAAILDQLVLPLVATDAEQPLVREIERRDAAWQAALTVALRTVGEQRCGADHLRAYGPTP